jgi:iron complex outermembrane recepter protein
MKLRNVFSGAATALFLSSIAGVAAAQDQSDQGGNLDTVVVTGVRASVQSALDQKKNSDQLQESIVAEDIGKLPDNNVIEALQHVTGIQISRNAAEANQLLIRGLPDIATLLNGREIFTSYGRFITLQDIPAELLSRVDVQKSSRADDIEGGIAGLIDVRLHQPFDFKDPQLSASVRGVYSSLSKKTDPIGNILASDRWQTSAGELGVLADVFFSKDQYKEEILDNYISTQPISPVAGSTGAGGVAYIPLTEGAQSSGGRRERLAGNLSIQWKPNDNTEAYTEAFYTRYRNPNFTDFFVGLPWIGANPATATVFPGTDEVKTVASGGYDLTSNQSFVAKTDTYQIATGGRWTNGNLELSTEVDYSNSRNTQTGYILDTEYNPPNYTADFNYHGTGTPYMNVSGIDMADPANFHIRQLYDQWWDQGGNEVDWRGDLSFKLDNSSWLKSIDAGVRFVDRFASNREDNQGGLDCRGVADPSSPTFAALTAAIASKACFTALNDLPGTAYHLTSGTMFNGDFGIRNWTDASPTWLNQNIGYLRELFGQSATGERPPADPTQSFDDREISYAGYAKANFHFEGSHPLVGNFGLRLVETRTTLRGNSLIVTTPDNLNYSFDYSANESKENSLDWLPSLNARLTLADDLYLRLAASRTVTRPTFLQLDPGLSLSASTATQLGTGASGNSKLSPEKSNNADLSLEYYYGQQSALTGGLFYRQIDGYIQQGIAPETIAGITYQVNRPTNAPKDHIEGMELSYTQFFDFLPSVFSGMGVQTNGTYVDGPFQNISKWSYNIIGIYEKGPASLRVTYNWRSGFNVGAAPGGGQQPTTIFAKAQPWLDMSASYKVTHMLTLTFDATNLLNSYYQDYFGTQSIYPRDTRRFDQTYSVGFRLHL